MPAPSPSRDSILQQLERMLVSETFSGAGRSQALLKFLVLQAVDKPSDRPKEYTLGAEALGRGESFDPRTDPIVRAEVSRLRIRLERYYAREGVTDEVLVTLPKGTYAPQFLTRVVPEADSAVAEARGPARPAQRLKWFAWGGLTVGGVLALSTWLWNRASPASEPGALEFDIELTRGELQLGSDFGPDVTLSPDGSRMVFVARGPGGKLRLMRRGLGQSDTFELPETDGARAPLFSPDGRWVGFWAEAKLKKTSVDGGSPVVLADAVDFGGASWGEDGEIVAALSRALVRIPSSPGESTVLADLTEEGVSPRWPHVLPGGRHVLYTAIGRQGPNAASIEALSIHDGSKTTVLRGGTYARYLRNGSLLYVNQGTLFAVPFDPEKLATRGTAVPVREAVSYASTFGFAQLDLSRTGTLVYRRSTARGQVVPSWIDESGRAEPLLAKPGEYVFPRLSPDGGRLALSLAEGGTLGTVVFDRRLDRTIRLPPGPGLMCGVFSPDGRFLVLGSMRGMYWTRTDDLTKLEPLTRSDSIQVPWSFTTEGTRLAYHDLGARTAFDIWTVPVQASSDRMSAGTPEAFLQTTFYETYPSFSPDGRWLSYGSGEYGAWEVYVRPFPAARDASAVRVSEGGGRISRWLPGGRRILYRTDDQRVMVVDYETKNGAFVAGKPRPWTPERLAETGVLSNFDLPRDGRIVALLPLDRDEDRRVRNHVTVVLNFSEEVRRRLSHVGK